MKNTEINWCLSVYPSGEIVAKDLIRDDEVLYCSSNGQFIGLYRLNNEENIIEQDKRNVHTLTCNVWINNINTKMFHLWMDTRPHLYWTAFDNCSIMFFLRADQYTAVGCWQSRMGGPQRWREKLCYHKVGIQLTLTLHSTETTIASVSFCSDQVSHQIWMSVVKQISSSSKIIFCGAANCLEFWIADAP